MLVDLFGIFNAVLLDFPNQEWFLFVIASASIFSVACLIKILIAKGDNK